MDEASRPWATSSTQDFASIQIVCDFPLRLSNTGERVIDLPDDLLFLLRTGYEDYAICLKALPMTPAKHVLGTIILVDEEAP
jgi:hypothetical protein